MYTDRNEPGCDYFANERYTKRVQSQKEKKKDYRAKCWKELFFLFDLGHRTVPINRKITTKQVK
jgi:hypothetical protein